MAIMLRFITIPSVLLLLLLAIARPIPAHSDDAVYIVYMGAANPVNLAKKEAAINSLLPRCSGRRELDLITTYQHALSGFAARMSPAEAKSISERPGVLSVFRDSYFQPLTTRSWDFLESLREEPAGERVPAPFADQDEFIIPAPSNSSSDVVIGFIDTGIWPESQSFRAGKASRTPPAGWNGICQTSKDFNKTACNGKIVGARFYAGGSARDIQGHGTHTASTAAGIKVKASYKGGVAAGTVRGGSESSRIAVYRVCDPYSGCGRNEILSAFDHAISDGVKVISVSLGSPEPEPIEFIEDPIAIGAFHAVEKGITVVCGGGNAGPVPATIRNDAPWIITVAGSTIDRDFPANVLLGGGTIIKGVGIGFPKLNRSAVYPLIYGDAAKATKATNQAARDCQKGSLDKAQGKIIFCEMRNKTTDMSDQVYEVMNKGGLGVIILNDPMKRVANYYGDFHFPVTVITFEESLKLKAYMKSTRKPVATILATVAVEKNYKPAPEVAFFSSRGPSILSANVVKPDITAPGADILAAWTGDVTRQSTEGAPPKYEIDSGTSMACPHISAVAANVRAAMPSLSPAGVKSAIMTTAVSTNNVGDPITTDNGELASPYDMGAGVVHPSGAVRPGLIYETTTEDYLHFLCYHGYNTSTVKRMSLTASPSFSCPAGGADSDKISSINYPSISVRLSHRGGRKIIPRQLTNIMATKEGTHWVYKSSVGVDAGGDGEVVVKVIPETLSFSKIGQRKNFKVKFVRKKVGKKVVSGWIQWTNPHFTVRSVFVVTMD